jgi:hypothetical protein
VLSIAYLTNNRESLIGQAVVLRQASNTDINDVAFAFADLVRPGRGGFEDIDATSFNLGISGLKPFLGSVAIVKPQ